MEIKVLKFGGSSLADAEQFKKVKDIIKAEKCRRYVVPSAPGKAHKDDTKITDLLYKCYELSKAGEDISECFEQITDRYYTIARKLGIMIDLDDEFATIRTSIDHHAGRDYVASRGEYLNGILLAEYLGFKFIDAADVIFFCENGSFDAQKTNEVLSEVLAKYEYAVIPGFYGSMPNGTIKTFSRGGSDVTGSIVARAANADLYENWTDVDGFLMADPRIVPSPKRIKTITYKELRELSYMGASVLHEDAIFPVRFAGIPINIKNTNNPSCSGTMIVASCDEASSSSKITGIAGKVGFSTISIEKDMMNSEIGFGRKVLSVLEEYGVSFEHFPSSIDTMSIIVTTAALEGKREKIVSEIFRAVDPEVVDIEDGIALVAVVGRGMKNSKGTARRIFSAISDANVNIRMIDQGSSELNIIIGVDESDYVNTLKAIDNEFEG